MCEPSVDNLFFINLVIVLHSVIQIFMADSSVENYSDNTSQSLH